MTGRVLLGSSFADAYRGMQEAQWLSSEELGRRTEDRLATLLSHAARTVPFYREYCEEAGLRPESLRTLEDLKRLPVVDKNSYREGPLSRFLAEDIGGHRRLEFTTSGSTGEPLKFCLDRRAMPLVFASHLFYDSWFGLRPFDRYVRFMAPPAKEPPLESRAPLTFRFKQQVSLHLKKLYESLTQQHFSMFDVDPAQVERICERMNAFRPAYVLGYTSTLATLADQLLQRGLRLDRPLKGVITIAEPLTPPRRKLIEEYFRARIINRYGQREFKYWSAQSCAVSDSRFHVNTELVVAEVLRADGSDAEPGEVGRLVMTNLHNHVMPFVRYDTADLASLMSGPCECGRGFPVIASLEGRSQEVLVTPSGRMVNPTSLGHFLFVVHDYVESLKHFQLVRLDERRVRALVVPFQPLGEEVRGRLAADLSGLLGGELEVAVEEVSEIALERSGKRPVIKSLAMGEARGTATPS
ncbi:MAG: hypothetical protein V2A76_16880 [Planctomycetota bacterium]